jgi:hypothetical protein
MICKVLQPLSNAKPAANPNLSPSVIPQVRGVAVAQLAALAENHAG